MAIAATTIILMVGAVASITKVVQHYQQTMNYKEQTDYIQQKHVEILIAVMVNLCNVSNVTHNTYRHKHIYTYTHIPTCMHACIRPYTHTCMQIHMSTCIHVGLILEGFAVLIEKCSRGLGCRVQRLELYRCWGWYSLLKLIKATYDASQLLAATLK